jgi:hypothetical protein
VKEYQRARAWLLRALEFEGDPEDELIAKLRDGRAQLWLGEKSAMVTEVHDEPVGRSLHVWLAGGDLAEIVSLTPGIAAWGRMMGCFEATIEGRTGWARVLKPYGFTGGMILRKALA